MADKSIGELGVAQQMTDEAKLVVYQDGETKSIEGQLIKGYAKDGVQHFVDGAAQSAQEAAQSAEAARTAREAVETYAEQAGASAVTAAGNAIAAQEARTGAEEARADAEDQAKVSKSYAVGGTGLSHGSEWVKFDWVEITETGRDFNGENPDWWVNGRIITYDQTYRVLVNGVAYEGMFQRIPGPPQDPDGDVIIGGPVCSLEAGPVRITEAGAMEPVLIYASTVAPVSVEVYEQGEGGQLSDDVDNAKYYKELAEAARDGAKASEDAAAGAASGAAAHQVVAETAKAAAEAAKTEAEAAKDAAAGSAAQAGESATAAKTSEKAAKEAETGAKGSEEAAAGSAALAKSEADRAKGEADRAAEIVGGDFATKSEAQGYVDAHAGDLVAHVTAEERAAWAAKETPEEAQAKADAAEAAAKAASRPGTWIPSAIDVGADPAGSAGAVDAKLTAHAGRTDNPHGVTAEQVGARPSTWAPAWGDVTGKPATFTPATHTHTKAQVAGLDGELARKADIPVEIEATLFAAKWNGSGPYTYVMTVSNILEHAVGYIGLAKSATAEQRTVAREAMLSVTGQAAITLIITADGEKPSVDIPCVLTILKGYTEVEPDVPVYPMG